MYWSSIQYDGSFDRNIMYRYIVFFAIESKQAAIFKDGNHYVKKELWTVHRVLDSHRIGMIYVDALSVTRSSTVVATTWLSKSLTF